MNCTNKSRTGGLRVAGFVTAYTAVLGAAVLWLTSHTDAPRAQAAPRGVDVAIKPIVTDLAAATVGFAGEVGSYKGTIVFDGAAPEVKLIHKMGDASVKDAAVCSAKDMPNESLVVDPKTKGIANVFVYLAKAPAGFKAAAQPPAKVVFDQKDCRFTPRCITAHTGQTVNLLNGDPITHNTRTSPLTNMGINQAIKPNDRDGINIVYKRLERVPVEVKCDFHAWMKGYHLVCDHPFMAVTDAEGKFEIKDLPAGKYEFIVWQESKGYLDRKHAVEVKAGKATEETLKFGAKAFAGFDGPKPQTFAVSIAP